MSGFSFYADAQMAREAAQLFSCGSPQFGPDIVCVYDATKKDGTPRYGVRTEGLFHPDVIAVYAAGVEQELDRESITTMVQA